MYLLSILKVARVGLTLTGSCQYNIYADLSATIDFSCVDEIVTSSGLSIGVYDEWPGISITLSAFLQIRSVTWWGVSLIVN